MINLYEVVKNTPQYFKQLQCKALLFTQYDCPQVERKESFFNESNYIAYVISGKRIFHRNGRSWDLSEGVSVFVKKGAHIAEKSAGEGWCVMVFFIPDNYLVDFMKANKKELSFQQLPEATDDYVLPLNVNDLTKSFFYSMLPYFTQDPPPHENLLELKFRELVFSLLLNNSNTQLVSYIDTLCDGRRESLQEIMNANYTFNLSLDQYAKLSHKSLPTFKREFKRVFKTTPGKWIMQKRLNFAAGLLQSSAVSVRDVAFESGFENPTHFSRVFKETFGVSPLQYRK